MVSKGAGACRKLLELYEETGCRQLACTNRHWCQEPLHDVGCVLMQEYRSMSTSAVRADSLSANSAHYNESCAGTYSEHLLHACSMEKTHEMHGQRQNSVI